MLPKVWWRTPDFILQPGLESLHFALPRPRRGERNHIALSQGQRVIRKSNQPPFGECRPCQQHLAEGNAGSCLCKGKGGA